jgi:succinate dehydrogenase/fumarate reductase flavoprotein subunit
VHLRTDYPRLDDAHWNTHLWFQRNEADALERWGAA